MIALGGLGRAPCKFGWSLEMAALNFRKTLAAREVIMAES
jgi:hypothetical protein